MIFESDPIEMRYPVNCRRTHLHHPLCLCAIVCCRCALIGTRINNRHRLLQHQQTTLHDIIRYNATSPRQSRTTPRQRLQYPIRHTTTTRQTQTGLFDTAARCHVVSGDRGHNPQRRIDRDPSVTIARTGKEGACPPYPETKRKTFTHPLSSCLFCLMKTSEKVVILMVP